MQVWDKFWADTKISPEEDKKIIADELKSAAWKKTEQRLLTQFGSLADLEVIEVGSGRGEVSLILAQKKAKVTLLDQSKYAFQKAKQPRALRQASRVERPLPELKDEYPCAKIMVNR